LYQPQWNLPEGQLSPSDDRSASGVDDGPQTPFMDSYSGYNQIKMHPPNEDKIAFSIGQGIYCYKVILFGLKNAGATFQRMVNKSFKNQIGSTMEVNVDDMLVKSIQHIDYLQYLDKTFDLLRQDKVKLNPEKCTFGVISGKFLGYLITQTDIDADPDQIFAILNTSQLLVWRRFRCWTDALEA